MLGISFFELLVVFCVVAVVTKPGDIPLLIKSYKKFTKKFVAVKRECIDNFKKVHNQIIDNDTHEEIDDYHYVMDNNGKLQKAYDVPIKPKKKWTPKK